MNNQNHQRKFTRIGISDARLVVSHLVSKQTSVRDLSRCEFAPINLSPGGVSIRASAPINIGAVLRVELQLRNEERILFLQGVVKTVKRNPKAKCSYVVGIHWIELTTSDQVYIKNHIMSGLHIV